MREAERQSEKLVGTFNGVLPAEVTGHVTSLRWPTRATISLASLPI
jgi:hypothetical protein